ncbi:MAG TPA: hypothetical protein VIX11_04255 [Candidatus Acidoferrum sp.]
MSSNEKQPRLGRDTTLAEWICVERLVAILFVAILLAASAGVASTPKFRLEVQFPNSGTEMHLLGIGQPDTSGHPEVRVGTGPQGPWSDEHYVVTEFEVLSIRQHTVGLRFRLKRFDRLLTADQVMHILETDKVSWHTINYVPGTRASIPMENGQPVVLSGSIVD